MDIYTRMWGSSRFFARWKRGNTEPMDSGLHIAPTDNPRALVTYCAKSRLTALSAKITSVVLVTHTRFALRDCELRVRRLNYLTNAPDMSGLILRCYRSKHRYTKYRGVTHCISLCPRRCGGGWFCGLPTRENRRKRNHSVCGYLHHNNIHNNSS